MSRSARIETRRRKVEQLLSVQLSHTEIARRLKAELGCSARTIHRDIREVYKRWELEAESEKPMRRHQMREQIRAYTRKAAAAGAWGAVASLIDKQLKLDALVEQKATVEHTGTISHVDRMTSEQRRAAWNEIISEYGVAVDDEPESKGNGRSDLN